MALVPFPASTAVVARAAALALIRGALGIADDDEGNALALRLGLVSSALVARYLNDSDSEAPTPNEIKDEAALRVAGWLNDTPAANVQALSVGRAVSFKFDSTMRNAMRNSGALSLLSSWRQHGAGVL